jgi:hypothetical protein
MPEVAALVTALILEHPTCVDCIVTKATTSRDAVDAAFARIAKVLQFRWDEAGRCRRCGDVKTIYWIERAAG